MGDTNIKVVVRCRPLNSRGMFVRFRDVICTSDVTLTIIFYLELTRGAKGLIQMVGNQTILNPPQEEGKGATASRATEKKPQNFTFDKSYWSAGPRDEPGYCSQQVGFGTEYR